MPIYQARTRAKTRRRTRQFFSFPPVSHPASPSTWSSTFFCTVVSLSLKTWTQSNYWVRLSSLIEQWIVWFVKDWVFNFTAFLLVFLGNVTVNRTSTFRTLPRLYSQSIVRFTWFFFFLCWFRGDFFTAFLILCTLKGLFKIKSSILSVGLERSIISSTGSIEFGERT